MTTVMHSRAELAAARATWATPVALVPTMGALHDGHRALIRAARASGAPVVVSVFVNPLQFAPNEDLATYPRTLDADVAMCEAEGVAAVWAPAVEDVYPGGPAQVRVDAGSIGTILEGSSRPTHFAGMLTVVAKLLNLVRPDSAYFGEKDYQQLVLITRMVTDLELAVRIEGVPTVREADGLALSSRNVFLSAEERIRALALSRALFSGRDSAGSESAVLDAAHRVLRDAAVDVDYLAVRGADLAEPPASGPARLLVAARIGTTRLIDNVGVTLCG